MKKAMFHKFTNFIQHAVDTFTPHLAPQEEFVYHWKSVTSYFVDNKDGSVRIEETALPEHLMSMLRIIQEEESDLGEAGTTGACLEYLLQHRLLETLYSLGRTDHPPGMKQLVLSFFTKLLSRITHPLLPHINVHRAVQRLVKACGETKAGPTEKEEIEFLCTVCAKIKTDPYLVNFFIEIPKTGTEKGQLKNPRPQAPFCLVDALLMLSDSQDARVSVKACEGLMLCASLPEQSAASALIQHTQFCQSIAGTMCQLYEKLPAMVNPESIETLEAKWGFDAIMESTDKQGFSGKLQVISFLSWLDYCDQLIAVANPHVGEALASEIHKSLFTAHFLPQLMQASESGAIVSTAYITRCLRTICSPALLREFCFFLLGADRKLIDKDSPGHPLYKRLLERCNHLSEEVCIATLKLFDTLLQKEDEHIFHCLLLRNLLGRSYLRDSSPPTPEDPKPVCGTDDSEKDGGKTQTEVPKADSAAASQDGQIGFPESQPLPSEVQELTVMPAELESNSDFAHPCTTSTENSGGIPQINSTELNQTQIQTAETSQSGSVKNSNFDTATSAENGAPAADSEEDQTKEALTCPDNVAEAGEINNQVQSSAQIAQSSTPSSPTSSYVSSSPSMSSSLSSGPSFSSPKFGGSEVHKIVNSFLSLLPEEAKSSYQTADSGYDMYLRDANKQFSIQEAICKNWDWPKRPLALPDYEMDKFHEGSFLHMLLDKLLHLLDQSYSMNLLLTALIAKVALLPHPNLHEFLLDPFLPTVEGTKTLYSVLIKVANEIKLHQKKDPTFSQKLLLARKQLLGIVPTIHKFEDQSRMEAIIVLEEFCKELSAITFVKYHAAVTRF